MSFLASGRCVLQEQHGGLVYEREEAEVTCVLACGLVDEETFGAEAA